MIVLDVNVHLKVYAEDAEDCFHGMKISAASEPTIDPKFYTSEDKLFSTTSWMGRTNTVFKLTGSETYSFYSDFSE